MSEPVRDPIPQAARAVLDLFRGALADVRFPDVDRSTIDRAALEQSEGALLDAQCALEDAEAALERARAVVAEHTALLSAKTARALAYAKVFAEGDTELRERLDAISVGAQGKREKSVAEASAAPKRTRRKKADDEATLFEESAAAASIEAAAVSEPAIELQ